jgi:hypothetical protein
VALEALVRRLLLRELHLLVLTLRVLTLSVEVAGQAVPLSLVLVDLVVEGMVLLQELGLRGVPIQVVEAAGLRQRHRLVALVARAS